MQIFRSLAGYSYGRADVVRRAMSKKKKDVMEAERVTFIEGCAKNNIDSSVANAIFDQMSEFAKYAFNKSHAACYALVAYRTAYLKKYYPAEFMAALLTSVLDSSNKVARYIAECKRLGLRLAVPDVNTSMKGFSANGRVINYGLLGIKNLGSEFINEIIKERENGRYKDLFDFCSRLQAGHFNRRAVESLIRCGALDSIGTNRRQMLQALPALVTNLENYRRKTMYGQVGFFDLGVDEDSFGFEFEMPDVDEFPKAELLKMEKEMTGLYLSGHPLDKYDALIEKLGYAKTLDLLEIGKTDVSAYQDKSRVTLCGIITHITLKQTRNGQNMAFVEVEDMLGSIEVLVFPKTLEQFAGYISNGNVITVQGTVSCEDEKDAKILANVITGAPSDNSRPVKKQTYSSVKTIENKTESAPKKAKRKGVFIRFKSKNDENIVKAMNVIGKYGGEFPLYFYYLDEKKYVLQNKTEHFNYNKKMAEELKSLLGNENVAVIE